MNKKNHFVYMCHACTSSMPTFSLSDYLFIYHKLYCCRNIEQCYHTADFPHTVQAYLLLMLVLPSTGIITHNCFPSNLFRALKDMSKQVFKSLYSLYYLCFTQHPNLFGIGVVLTDSVLCHFHVRLRSTEPIEHHGTR